MSGPYANGTECVVTQNPHHPQFITVGTIVTVVEPAPEPLHDPQGRLRGLPAQWIEAGDREGYWAVPWMRPVDEDTDESDDEVVREYSNPRMTTKPEDQHA